MELTYAIILAGGRGLRLGGKTPKQFLTLGTRPVIAWSMELCDNLPEIDRIITVVPEDCIPEINSIVSTRGLKKILPPIPGGATRQESAYNALTAIDYSSDDIIIFHDAARPFVWPETMLSCIAGARQYGAAASYVPVHDTIAEIDHDVVISVPERDRMYYAQTPQGFRYSIIKTAHDRAREGNRVFTDDVSLVLAAGHMVRMIDGDYSNFKITTDYDYQVACSIAENVNTKHRR